jgi:hypothetical protein
MFCRAFTVPVLVVILLVFHFTLGLLLLLHGRRLRATTASDDCVHVVVFLHRNFCCSRSVFAAVGSDAFPCAFNKIFPG